MTFTAFSDPQNGEIWEVDQQGLWLLLRAGLRASIIRERTTIEQIDNGFMMPTTFQVNTDWTGFRAKLDTDTQSFFDDTNAQLLDSGVSGVPETLAGIRDVGIAKTQEVEDMQKKAQSDSFDNIDSTVQGAETAKAVLEVVRDTSATILVAGASVLSGGAALGVLGAGSALKGVAKFQDTGSVASAIIEGTGTFVVGALRIQTPGVSISPGDTKILVFVASGMDGMMTGVKALVDGQSSSTALTQAAAKTGLGLVFGLTPLRPQNLPMFAKIVAKLPQDTDQLIGPAAKAAADKLVKDKLAGTIPKILQPQRPVGKLDFAAAVGKAEVPSDLFVKSFVLRKVAS